MTVFSFKMPDIGEGVVEGEVISWLKNPGDAVNKDEPVVIVMTDKATVELPTPYSGKVLKQYYTPGQMAKKGLPLFDIETEDEIKKEAEKIVTQEKKEEPSLKPFSTSGVLSTPPVRKLAKELHISLADISGTGPQGRITKEDLEKHLQKGSSSPVTHLTGDKESPFIGIPQKMATKMAESHAIIPPFSYMHEFEVSRLVDMKNKWEEKAKQENIHLTYIPFILRALSLTIQKFPLINSSYDEKNRTLIEHTVQNIGIAMATPLGLIVPVLKGVEKMNLTEIVYAYEQFKERGKKNKLSSEEMKEGTITLTNFGALAKGAKFATPIINYPEVAILGIARIHPEPIVEKGEVAVKEVVACSWSFDHRVINGELAAQVAEFFAKLLQNPSSLL